MQDILHTDIYSSVNQVGRLLISKELHLISVESCTGGGVGYYCTSIPGSSNWYECGFITYHNSDKIRLGVPNNILEKYGAVSEECALIMAESALNTVEQTCEKNYCSLAISGIAGPGGGSKDKPVGTVSFAWVKKYSKSNSDTKIFKGTREEIRHQSIIYALQGLNNFLETGYK